MQAATAAGLRPSADARTIAWGILAVLLAAALLALGFIQLLDAGSNIPDADVESGRVLQFDAAPRPTPPPMPAPSKWPRGANASCAECVANATS